MTKFLAQLLITVGLDGLAFGLMFPVMWNGKDASIGMTMVLDALFVFFVTAFVWGIRLYPGDPE